MLSAMRAIVSSPGCALDFPIPSLSNRITRWPVAASASTKLGGHASIDPLRPMIITIGRPSPIDR